ncbi:MAG: hypothetical protein GC136_08145 [Alphaproteobacteria bacterium]|nr:hypothetical protein [Alphaproteobacteria bacterium]
MARIIKKLPDGTPVPRALQSNPFFYFAENENLMPAWDEIRPEHVRPAIDFALDLARKNIDSIRTRAQADIDNNTNTATYENTVGKLLAADELLAHFLMSMFHTLPESASARKAYDKLGRDIILEYVALYEDIFLDPALYKAVCNVGVRPSALDREEKRLQEMYKNAFRPDIIYGSAAIQAEYRSTNKKIFKLEMQLANRMRKAAEETLIVIDDPTRLSGISPILVNAAKENAERNGLRGRWAFSMDRGLFAAVMKSADDRKLRKEYWDAFYSRGSIPPYDNRDMILELVKLRQRQAEIQGEASHAHATMKYQMAGVPENAEILLEDLRLATMPVARKELRKITKFMRDTTSYTKLNPWDVDYYKSKLKKEEFGFDDEDLRPYFEFNKVMDGVMKHFERVYPGIKIERTDQYATYHPDQLAYNVLDKRTGKILGVQFMDPFSRPHKPAGVAWSARVRGRGVFMEEMHGAINSVVTKLTKGSAGKPTLMTFRDVEVIMHEFGHGTHEILSKCKSQALSGFGVARDWVEFPSQIQENWCYQPQFINSIARHHETGKPLPKEWVDKLSRSRGYMNGLPTLEIIKKGTLDLAWAQANPAKITSVEDFERAALKKYNVMDMGKALYSPWFDHIFAGGYSAGFYSYQWAQFFEADAYALYYHKKNVYHPDVNRRLKSVIEQGASAHPVKLFRDFRGRAMANPMYIKIREGLDASRGVEDADPEEILESLFGISASPNSVMKPWAIFHQHKHIC